MFNIFRLKSKLVFGLILWVLFGTNLWAGWEIQTVDSIGNVGVGSSIALDKNGYPHISYWDNTNWYLKYAEWDGTSWEIQTVDSSGNANYMTTAGIWNNTSIDLDDHGYPHISYGIGDGRLKYGRLNGTIWKIQVVDSSANGLWNSIAIDSENNPHISYTVSGAPESKELKYTYWDGIVWHSEVIDTGSVYDNSLALDRSGNPRISYCDADLMYAQWNGIDWQIQKVDTTRYYGWYNSLALDSDGYSHISYDYTDGYSTYGLKYARWTGTVWEIQTVEGDESQAGKFNSLALDTNNYPCISYTLRTIPHSLKYAQWDGTTWKIQIVDSSDASDISIALDTSCYPHLSYFGKNKDLKYARWIQEGIKEENLHRPLGGRTFRIHSNPFSISTTIEFDISEFTTKNLHRVSLKIYTPLGELVRVLVDGIRNADHYRIKWDGRNQKGAMLPAGVYFCQLMVGFSAQAKKVTLIK